MVKKFGELWKLVLQSALLYGAAGTVVRVGANVLLLPVVLKTLSASELALWWMFLALGGLANLADFGFSQAITRIYSYLWAGASDFDVEGMRPPPEKSEPNLECLRRLNATARSLYVRLAWGSTAVLAVVGSIILMPKVQASSQPLQTWLTWMAFLLAVGYGLGSSHWFAACQGTNRMRDLQASNLWSGLAYLAVAGILLIAGCGLLSMVLATAMRGLIARHLCCLAYCRVVPDVGGKPAVADMSMLDRIWPNAWKFGVLSLGVYFITNSGVIISGYILGDEVTASYGLTAQIGLFLTNFSALWLTVKWPQLTILRTQGRLDEMAALFARRLALMVATFLFLATALVLFGNPILEWKGSNTKLLSTPYLIVYLFYLGQQQFYAQFGTLTFTENVVPFFKLSLFTGLGLAYLSVVMTAWFDLWGLVLAPLIATMAGSTWYPVWRGFRGQPLTVRQFIRVGVLGRT